MPNLLNWRYSSTLALFRTRGLKPKSIPVLVCGLKLHFWENIYHNFWLVEYWQFNEIDITNKSQSLNLTNPLLHTTQLQYIPTISLLELDLKAWQVRIKQVYCQLKAVNGTEGDPLRKIRTSMSDKRQITRSYETKNQNNMSHEDVIISQETPRRVFFW